MKYWRILFWISSILLFSCLDASPKKVLVINATEQEKKELQAPSIKKQYRFRFEKITTRDHTFLHGTFHKTIDHLCQKYKHRNLDGILCTQDYQGNLCATLCAKKLGLLGPNLKAVLTCHHKYYSRCTQQDIVPEATPLFGLIDPKQPHKSIDQLPFSFPFFIKPIKAYFSFGAQKVHTTGEVKTALSTCLPEPLFLAPLNTLLREQTFEHSADYLLAESILKGKQCTLEGFVQNGICYILGVVDSIMYPRTISFEHFEYPSHLPRSVQNRMGHIAQKMMKSLRFNHSFFNIEFMYNPATNTIHIIEINPRSCAQFADFYEKVHGINSYELMLAVATNSSLPSIKNQKGAYRVAASFALRTFQDGVVLSSPSKQNLKKAYRTFPDARIQPHVEKGTLLSEALQDGKSYLYTIINLGGKNRNDLMRRFKECKALLPYTFTFNPS